MVGVSVGVDVEEFVDGFVGGVPPDAPEVRGGAEPVVVAEVRVRGGRGPPVGEVAERHDEVHEARDGALVDGRVEVGEPAGVLGEPGADLSHQRLQLRCSAAGVGRRERRLEVDLLEDPCTRQVCVVELGDVRRALTSGVPVEDREN